MTSSATFTDALDNADFIDEAFERCLIDPATLVSRHYISAKRSLLLLFADWATDGVRLFQIDEQTQTLTQSDADYTVASGTLYIIEGRIRRSSTDTAVARINRDQYMAIPTKTSEGLPTQVWLDRATGLYTLWQVPENSTDVFRYSRLRRMQDAGDAFNTPDLSFWWWEALAAGLAWKLAEKFAPQLFEQKAQLHAGALARAKSGDREPADANFGVSAL